MVGNRLWELWSQGKPAINGWLSVAILVTKTI